MTSQGSCVGEVGLPISRNRISEAPISFLIQRRRTYFFVKKLACRALEDAINVAYAREFISGAAPQNFLVSVPNFCSETATTSDEDDAATIANE